VFTQPTRSPRRPGAGYWRSPSATARTRSPGRSPAATAATSGIVVPDIANAFSAMITKAVQQEVRRDGYALFVAGSDELPQDEVQWARAMAPQVDGLLLVSPLMPDSDLNELARLAPVVLANRVLEGIPAVITDVTEATGHAVEHVHALGHRGPRAGGIARDGPPRHPRARGDRARPHGPRGRRR